MPWFFKFSSTKRKIWFCVINTTFSIFLFLFIQKSNFAHKNQHLFSLGKSLKQIFHKEELPTDFLVINTAFDKMLVDNYINSGQSQAKRGNIAITDRRKLVTLFEQINKSNVHKYIISNLIFDQPSTYDKPLAQELLRTKRMALGQSVDENKILPIFSNLNLGINQIYMTSGVLNKVRLFEHKDGQILKTLPLKLYEDINGVTIAPGYFYSVLGNQKIFNDFPLENIIQKDSVAVINLSSILQLSKSDFEGFSTELKNRIIIIDDFYNNSYGSVDDNDLPAAVIMANAYLTLKDGMIDFSWWLIGFLALVFLGFSYLVIVPQNKFSSPIFNQPILSFLIGGIGYVLVFALISVILYMLLGNRLNLIYMGLFFYFENLVVNRKYHSRKLKKRLNLES